MPVRHQTAAFVGLALAGALGSAGCSATAPDPAPGSGGSGPSAGGVAAGGSGTMPAGAGSGGSADAGSGSAHQPDATPGDGQLGDACAASGVCASGLSCVTSLAGDAARVAGGLCSATCATDADCAPLAARAYCVALGGDTVGHCLEGCTSGVGGEPKCHERHDVACGLLGVVSSARRCESSNDCDRAEFCDSSADPPVCETIETACVPHCAGDFDCAAGSFCDFASGLCQPEPPGGQAIGTPCDPRTAVDPCNGFCRPLGDSAETGVCSAFCTLAPGLVGCGWDGTGPADAGCLFGTRLSSGLGAGDVGFCGALCDCNDDCAGPGDRCVDDSHGQIRAIWGRAGYCRPLVRGETEADAISECE